MITQEYAGSSDTRWVSYDAIAIGFNSLNALLIESLSIDKHIHIPFIGAGLANGKWSIISKIIEETVALPVTCWSLDRKYPDGLPITV